MATQKSRDLCVAIAVAAAASTAVLVLAVSMDHEEEITEVREKIAKYRYRLPLPVPEGAEEFMLRTKSDSWCKEFLRFPAIAVRALLPFLSLNEITYRSRYNCSAETALCLFLYRMAAPNRYKEDMPVFGRSRPWLSTVFNDVVSHLCNRYKKKMEWDSNRLTHAKLQEYAEAIENRGGVRGIWGFIDGTMRVICRSVENQVLYYSGYKKAHAIKFQAVMTPDGLVSHLGEAFEGREGDWGMFVKVGLEAHLRAVNINPQTGNDLAEDRLYIHGDPAYYAAYGVMGAYRSLPDRPLDNTLKAVNSHLSGLRISVEHGFGKIMKLWAFNGYKGGLQSGISPVGAYFMLAVFLSNIHTCIYGSQTTRKFGIRPPTVPQYLHIQQ